MFTFEQKIELLKEAAAGDRRKKRVRRQADSSLSTRELIQGAAMAYAPFSAAKHVWYDINAARAMMNAAKILRAV